jgi:hypothetical protein
MQHNKITNMRYTFLYLFICYFTNIIPSIEYAQIKENQIISKAFFINACTYLFYCFYLIQILGFTNPTPLTEISSSRLIRKGIQNDWFTIQLLVYNWFKDLEFHFLVNS